MNNSVSMRRFVFIIHGEVQRVGYRDRVHKIANRGGITGQVRNLDELDVEIIAEGQSDQLDQFTSAIRIHEYPIVVESVEIREEKYSGSFSSFQIIRGNPDEELAERMDAAIHHLSFIGYHSKKSSDASDKIISMMKDSLGKQDLMLDRQDQMLEKQDRMISSQDLMLGKQDQMLKKQDRMVSTQEQTLEELKGVRTDLKKTVTQEISEMRIELQEVRAALVRAGLMEPAKG